MDTTCAACGKKIKGGIMAKTTIGLVEATVEFDGYIVCENCFKKIGRKQKKKKEVVKNGGVEQNIRESNGSTVQETRNGS